MDYLTFRQNALAGMTLLKTRPKFKSAEEQEAWIRQEYERHHGSSVNPNVRLPDSVWNDPEFQKELNRRAEEDEVLNRYEKGMG